MDEYESHRFSVNQCESHVKSDLDMISLSIDSRDNRKLKFLIDTGAEISIIRSSSLTPGVNYQFHDDSIVKLIIHSREISIIRSSSLTPGVNYQFHDDSIVKLIIHSRG